MHFKYYWLVNRLKQEVNPNWINPQVYLKLYKLVRGYNEQKPFHEDTGKRYSPGEREQFQRSNIKTLELLTKSKSLTPHVRFERVKSKIDMYVDGKIYRPRYPKQVSR